MSISYIVEHVRLLIDDLDGEKFEVYRIEDVLKQRREEMRYIKCTPLATRASGGDVTYMTFTAPFDWGWWDTSAELLDYNYDALTPTIANWRVGRWVFSSEPTKPVYITGFTYDIYAAAADLLELRASQVAEDIQSFSVAHGTFSYANKRRGPLEMVEQYRAKQRPSVAVVYRTDAQ